MFNKRLKRVSVMLISILLFNFCLASNTFASSTSNIVSFSESTSSSQSKSVTIKNLGSVTSASVNTGNVTYSVNNNVVTINVSNGTPTRSSTPSKTATDSRTSSTNSFSSSISYNSGEYSGNLSKNGSSFVISGSAAGSKTASGTHDSIAWNQYRWNGSSWVIIDSYSPNTPTISYGPDSDGYSGTLSKTSASYISSSGTAPSNPSVGTTYTQYNTWRGYYSGTVTKPDNRVYQQNYSGTVYGTTIYYYTYTVTLNYNLLDIIVAHNPIQSSQYWGIGEYDAGGSAIIPCAAVCHVDVLENYTRTSSSFTTIDSSIFAYASDWNGGIGGYDLIVEAGSQVSFTSYGSSIGSHTLSSNSNVYTSDGWIWSNMSSTSPAYYGNNSLMTATGSGCFTAPDAVIWPPLYLQPASRSFTTSVTF